jgi:fructosamine-3-kinase
VITTTCPKHSRTTDPNYFAVETAGLRWLADAGSGSARVVGVLEVSADHLTLERVTSTRPLAGWCGDGYIGRPRMTMRPTAAWSRFYADQRVRAVVGRAGPDDCQPRPGPILWSESANG